MSCVASTIARLNSTNPLATLKFFLRMCPGIFEYSESNPTQTNLPSAQRAFRSSIKLRFMFAPQIVKKQITLQLAPEMRLSRMLQDYFLYVKFSFPIQNTHGAQF